MTALSDAVYRIAILSNGKPALLESLVETAGIGEFVDTTISAATVGTFKHDARLYEAAADRLDAPIDRIVHVGAGWGDVLGCTHAGMQSVWLNRVDVPWPRFDGNPDTVADSMADVVALLTDD